MELLKNNPSEETEQASESKNPLKSEHLKEGIQPIMFCIGTPQQFQENPGAERETFREKSSNNNKDRNINYYGDPKELNRQNFRNAGEHSYVISSVDGSNKFSKSFKNCTGLIVAGIDRVTGKNISFMSHEDPDFFLGGEFGKTSFIDDLTERLDELKERSIEGTVDAVIMGGNYFADRPDYQDNYLKSIGLL